MLTALANYQALAQLIQPRATCDNISVGNKLGLSDIYVTCGKVALEHQKHIYLQGRKLKHLEYVTHEGVTQVGSNQGWWHQENNGS